jgi:hypothetical protein
VVRRETVTGVLWDARADVGIVATIGAADLVDAVDDLPPAGIVRGVDASAFARVARGLRGASTVAVGASTDPRVPLTLGSGAAVLRVAPQGIGEDLAAPPLGAPGPSVDVDARDLARALGAAAQWTEGGQDDRVLLSWSPTTLRVLGASAHRVLAVSAPAFSADSVGVLPLPRSASKMAASLLRSATGRASVQATSGLVTLTSTTAWGSLGVVCQRHTAEDANARVAQIETVVATVDARRPALVAQIDAGDLRTALRRGAALGHLGLGALVTVLTSDARGLVVGHVLSADDPVDALHVEPLDGWTTGRGTVAVDPRLLRGLLPRTGPVLLDCGAPDEPVRVRVVEGALSLDSLVMPYAPKRALAWGAYVLGGGPAVGAEVAA